MTKLMAATLALAAFSVPRPRGWICRSGHTRRRSWRLGLQLEWILCRRASRRRLASRDFSQTAGGFGVVEAGTTKPSGVVGGGQIGWNWQFAPNWLLGVEADISGADLRDA